MNRRSRLRTDRRERRAIFSICDSKMRLEPSLKVTNHGIAVIGRRQEADIRRPAPPAAQSIPMCWIARIGGHHGRGLGCPMTWHGRRCFLPAMMRVL
jgi:hypothetical protein